MNKLVDRLLMKEAHLDFSHLEKGFFTDPDMAAAFLENMKPETIILSSEMNNLKVLQNSEQSRISYIFMHCEFI